MPGDLPGISSNDRYSITASLSYFVSGHENSFPSMDIIRHRRAMPNVKIELYNHHLMNLLVIHSCVSDSVITLHLKPLLHIDSLLIIVV